MRVKLPFPTARIVVVSDFNCPYCFTLNEWIAELGLSSMVRWVGIEHRPELPREGENSQEEASTLSTEVADVLDRAPEVGVVHPKRWLNSREALLVQNAVEDDFPELAPRLRRAIFQSYWREGESISDLCSLNRVLDGVGIAEVETEPEYLEELSLWWKQEIDRIPCMIAPTGIAHLGLQTRQTVETFINSALHPASAGPGCGTTDTLS